MTKQEQAELIVKNGGCCTIACCDCKLKKECEEAQGEHSRQKVVVESAKQYLKETQDWKPLEIDNLPPDILTGEYEFSLVIGDDREEASSLKKHELIYNLMELNCKYDYRTKSAPKTQRHEDIMSLWWEIEKNVWQKVDTVNNRISPCEYIFNGTVEGEQNNKWNRSFVTADWFANRKSAKYPPEDSV